MRGWGGGRGRGHPGPQQIDSVSNALLGRNSVAPAPFHTCLAGPGDPAPLTLLQRGHFSISKRHRASSEDPEPGEDPAPGRWRRSSSGSRAGRAVGIFHRPHSPSRPLPAPRAPPPGTECLWPGRALSTRPGRWRPRAADSGRATGGMTLSCPKLGPAAQLTARPALPPLQLLP